MYMMAYLRRCSLLILSFVVSSLQQDPIVDFCRRWDHQTAVIDSRLYIDGGMVSYDAQGGLNYTSMSHLVNDLKTPLEGTGFPTQHSNLSKPANVPSLLGGYNWADQTNKAFYQFGGEFPTGASPTDFGSWTYDVVLNQWNITTLKTSDKDLQRVSYGAGTQSDESGLGFYFGGYVNGQTTPGWKGGEIATSGIVRFDFNTGNIKNGTGPDDIGRAEGQMVFVPASDSGVLIYFGGIEDPSRNGSQYAANMTTIHIYDITSSKWYTQTATGNVPLARRGFCADVAWADDKSSYNIYLYGGYGFGAAAAFNDVYILSLPSFTWVKAYPLDGSDAIPDKAGHGGCSANIVNRDQMLVIGGWFPASSDCDSPETQGQHNMILGNNTAKQFMWDQYDPKLSTYAVPSAVIDAIGGGPTGGATVTAPASWGHPDLANYYKLKPTFSARTATRALPSSTSTSSSSSGSKSKVGAIAGGVVGGLAVLIIILCLILFCLHRRKKAKKQEGAPVPPPQQPPAELEVTAMPHEMSTPNTHKYMTVQERPNHSVHTSYSGEPMQARTVSHDYSQSYPNQLPPSYGASSPLSPPAAFHPSPDPEYVQHSRHTSNPELFMGETGYNPARGTWEQQPSPGQNDMTRQYSYPTPTSPLQQHPPMPAQPQSQVYYPPPADPASRSQHSQPSFSDHRGSPTMTQHSGDASQRQTPNVSTTATPAQFYAQPVPNGQYSPR